MSFHMGKQAIAYLEYVFSLALNWIRGMSQARQKSSCPCERDLTTVLAHTATASSWPLLVGGVGSVGTEHGTKLSDNNNYETALCNRGTTCVHN
jgi:hypothetical protein